MHDIVENDVKKWVLQVGAGEIGLNSCIDENGKLTHLENGSFLMNEEDALKEGKRQYKRIHFYLCGPREMITWDAK